MYPRDLTTQLCLSCLISLTASTLWSNDTVIQFDLHPTAAATAVDSDSNQVMLVRIPFRLSSMIVSPKVPEIDQWIITCQPRGTNFSVADYAPRTETSSDVRSPIQVKQTQESTESLGLSIDGAWGHVMHGNFGADQGKKDVETIEFERHAQVQAVKASGTINRGRGVYFKLRPTAQQVLEGEKEFQITLTVPSTWRGGLVDFAVVAQSERKKFGGLDHEIKTIGSAKFVVATYRAGDEQAASRAAALAAAEYQLRHLADQHPTQPSVRSLPSLLRSVAVKLDLDSKKNDLSWLYRLLDGQADPHLDYQITKLPMPIRLAALDYADSRDAFFELQHDIRDENLPQRSAPSTRVMVAKPVVE